MSEQPSKQPKRVHAPRAVLWLIPTGLLVLMEFVGLRDRNGWGPLSNAVWVVTDSGSHGVLWWLVGALMGWLTLHFLFPGTLALGWRGLIWFGLIAVFAWASGRYLLHIL